MVGESGKCFQGLRDKEVLSFERSVSIAARWKRLMQRLELAENSLVFAGTS